MSHIIISGRLCSTYSSLAIFYNSNKIESNPRRRCRLVQYLPLPVAGGVDQIDSIVVVDIQKSLKGGREKTNKPQSLHTNSYNWDFDVFRIHKAYGWMQWKIKNIKKMGRPWMGISLNFPPCNLFDVHRLQQKNSTK